MRQPSIRVYYNAGPVRHDDEVCLIGPYPDLATRDLEIERLQRLAGDPATTPWAFDAEHADRDDADLWAPKHGVSSATADLTEPGSLTADPDRILRLFQDPTEFTRGWFSVFSDSGDWVDVPTSPDTDPLFELTDTVTAADGAGTTVGDLAALAFWFDLEPGQTEAHDALRLHLLQFHCQLNATVLTDDQALEHHHAEHFGPGGIRNHDADSTDWDMVRGAAMLAEVEEGFLTEEDADRYATTFNAHVERLGEPGRARVKPWETAPRIYEEPTRYTISVLPADDPWRRHYVIDVERRGDGKWSVLHSGYWTNAAGEWAVPYSGGHVQEYLFELDEALALARRLAPTVETNERTALDVLNLPRGDRR